MKKLTTSNCMATKKLIPFCYIINPSDSVSGVPFVVVYFDK